MKELLIAKDVAYAAKQGGGTISGYNELDQLAQGALAVLAEDGTLITSGTAAASLVNFKQYYMAVGRTNDTKRSKLFDRDGFHRSDCPYVAPVKQVQVVGDQGSGGSLNFPATLIPRTVAHLDVGVQYEGEEPHINWSRYEYTVKAGDAAADVVLALVAKINNDSKARWTAAAINSNGGIQITSTEDDEVMYLAVDGILQDATRTITTDVVYGKGTPSQVREYARLTDIQDGDENRVEYSQEYWKVVDEVDDAAQYELKTIEWQSEHRTPYNVQSGNSHEIVVAIPSGAQETELDAILTLILSSPTTTAGGSVSGL